MNGKWKKLFLILLLPIMIFFEGCSCGGLGESESSSGYPFEVHFYMGYEGADGYYPLQIPDQSIPSGGTITKPADPVWEDHYFEGWYKDMECTIPWDFAFDTVKGTTNLYAKWLGEYLVKFNLHSVSCVPVAIADRIVIEDHKVEDVPIVTLANHTFGGWFLDDTYTDSFDIENDVVTGNITLHAKWIPYN